MEAVDIIGFTLGDAKNILLKNGIKDFTLKITSSPRLKCDEYDENYRVVNVKNAGKKEFEIVICKPL